MNDDEYKETTCELAFDVVKMLSEREPRDEKVLDAALTAYLTLAGNKIGVEATVRALRMTADALSRAGAH